MPWTLPPIRTLPPSWTWYPIITDEPTLEPTYDPTISPDPTSMPTDRIHKVDLRSFEYSLKYISAICLTLFLLYSFLRTRKSTLAAKIFSPRTKTARIPPVKQPSSIFGWIEMLASSNIPHRIHKEVGLDAFVIDRILVCFAKAFAIIGVFSLLMLMPFYASEARDPRSEIERFRSYTIDSLWQSARGQTEMWIPVAMTWFNSIVVMYFLHNEYKTYIKHRHAYLKRQAPHSYTVLVERVPSRNCNETFLLRYFRNIFGDKVVSVNVVENNPRLNYAVKQRLKVVEMLEDAYFELQHTGARPWRMYFPWLRCGQVKHQLEPLGVDSASNSQNYNNRGPLGRRLSSALVRDDESSGDDDNPGTGHEHETVARIDQEEEAFLRQWHEANMNANSEVTGTRKTNLKLWCLARINFFMYIDKIQSYKNELDIWNQRVATLQKRMERTRKRTESEALSHLSPVQASRRQRRLRNSVRRAGWAAISLVPPTNHHVRDDDVRSVLSVPSLSSPLISTPGQAPFSNDQVDAPNLLDIGDRFEGGGGLMSSSDSDTDESSPRGGIAGGISGLVRYGADPFSRKSAFVSFSSLTAAMCAAQTIMDKPLRMNIMMAPELRDILWNNIGLSMSVQAISTWLIRILMLLMVLSFGGLTTLVAKYTSLEMLRYPDGWIDDFLKKHSKWVVVFESFSPMILMIVYKIVPPIVNFILKLERRRSLSEHQIEFFRIYYWFLIIQVFLFFIIAGSISNQLDDIVSNPKHVLVSVAQSLQNFELFFLNYMVTRLGLLPVELLRLSDLSLAILRGFVKRSRTARARRNSHCGCHTIDNPSGGTPERTIANILLCFTIGLSYSVACPIISLFSLVYALASLLVYRNQFLYVYTHERESGGIIFPSLFRALMMSVTMFQLIMVGLFLFHQEPSSAASVLPLMLITLSYILFCDTAYESSSQFLPLGLAAELDKIVEEMDPIQRADYRHPSILAPANMVPESPDETPFQQVRRISFSVHGIEPDNTILS